MHVTPENLKHSDHVLRLTREWYDGEASYYARRTAVYDQYPGLLEEIEVFDSSLDGASGTVLDLGCGAGRDTEFLLDRGHVVVAGDVSAEMLRTTIDRCRPARAVCVQLDMRRLPFAGGSFMGAWVCASMVHVPDVHVGGCLAELHRTLLPDALIAISMKSGSGGKWVSSGPSQRPRWFTYLDSDVLLPIMRANGFVDLSVVSSGRGSWYTAHGRRDYSAVRHSSGS
jgi:SAM-dependent methyltransferase